ncbi:phage holin [Pediococcus claussenii]|uniref:phage holin n=1 Tax=Pediococcus claussenii TaxID=187452 RepID=UPI00081A7751|nr:phage holin [Pediococcus claussenii]ANZ70385.1 hypothetical protein AYR57_08675 [Pediococcus claussenii]ANZ72201.1 hypothetical protein AYR58_08675 [Pediococcus claussenii]
MDNILNNLYAIAALAGFLATILGYVNPLLKQKIAKEKNLRVKSRYELLDTWATNAASAMQAVSDLPGQEKKEQAIQMVNQQLADHNIPIDVDNVAAAVEKAAQNLSKNGGNA